MAFETPGSNGHKGTSNVRVGVKLDIGFAETELYRQLGDEPQILAYLRDLGVQAAETAVGPETEEAVLRAHARRCGDAGLRLSLHPYSEATPFNPAFFSTAGDNSCRRMHQRFFAIAADVAQRQGSETVVNIHSAAGPREAGRETLIEQSVRFFEWANHWCGTNAPGARPVAELQIRPKLEEALQRVGDNYEELLTVVERSNCGACWDFGHAYMNARRFGLPLDPPKALLSRIAHVHCHDADHEDHRPLILGNVPWQRFLRRLGTAGFEGTVILEVPPHNFSAAGGLDVAKRSIQTLKERVGELSGSGPT